MFTLDKLRVMQGRLSPLKMLVVCGIGMELQPCRRLLARGSQNPENCKFPAAIAEITVIGVCEVIPCTEEAKKIIESVKAWKE